MKSQGHLMSQINVWIEREWIEDLRMDCRIFIEGHFEAALNRLKYGVDSPHGDGWHPPTFRHPSTIDPGLRVARPTQAELWFEGADWMHGEIAQPEAGRNYPRPFQFAPGDNPYYEER